MFALDEEVHDCLSGRAVVLVVLCAILAVPLWLRPPSADQVEISSHQGALSRAHLAQRSFLLSDLSWRRARHSGELCCFPFGCLSVDIQAGYAWCTAIDSPARFVFANVAHVGGYLASSPRPGASANTVRACIGTSDLEETEESDAAKTQEVWGALQCNAREQQEPKPEPKPNLSLSKTPKPRSLEQVI